MTKKITLLLVAVAGAFALTANAVPVHFTFQENGSNIALGTSSTFNNSGFALTAYGFTTAGDPTALYAKDLGGNEVGLGIASDSDHEINTTSFIQLLVPTSPPSNFDLVLSGSVQSGESFNVFFSSVLGTLGVVPIGTLNSDGSLVIGPAFQNGYIGITAGSGNVLLAGADFSPRAVPDAGFTASLLGLGLVGLAVLRRKLNV